MYNTNIDIRFKTAMLKPSFCDYSDTYILVKGEMTITGAGANAVARQADERNKGIIIKSCSPFIKRKSDINNTEINNATDIDTVMPMYNLIEYSHNYSQRSGSLWQYYKDKPNYNLAGSESFKPKIKITGNTTAGGHTKQDVEIIVPLKYLSNLWRTLECHQSIVKSISF